MGTRISNDPAGVPRLRGIEKRAWVADDRRRGVAVSTRGFCCCVAVVLTAGLTQPVFALDPRYPDWPCKKLRVRKISRAAVWSGPAIEGIDKTQPVDPKLAELAARLAARRTPID